VRKGNVLLGYGDTIEKFRMSLAGSSSKIRSKISVGRSSRAAIMHCNCLFDQIGDNDSLYHT
jgi:hypothetical protein